MRGYSAPLPRADALPAPPGDRHRVSPARCALAGAACSATSISEELVIAVLLGIAGLFVPVPIMMLAVLTGVVQAYIFAVLTVVYVSAAVRAHAS